jgi:hypothetical protein
MGSGTVGDALFQDLQILLAIVRRRQSSPSSPQKAWIFFSRYQQRCSLGHSLLFAAQLLLESLDLTLVLGAELLQLLLLLRLDKLAGLRLQGKHWLVVGILGCLAPALHLLGEQTPLAAVGAELGDIEAGSLQHHRELVSGTLTLRVFLGCRHHLSLQTPGLPPFVEGITWMPSSSEMRATLCL